MKPPKDWGKPMLTEALPPLLTTERAMALKHDSFYALPKIIRCFVDRANNELPSGYVALPWTINRMVSIFKMGDKEPLYFITYEDIEDNIVFYLDFLQYFINGVDFGGANSEKFKFLVAQGAELVRE